MMKVEELIEVLKTMPPDAEVFHLWDGEPRTAIELVWVSKSGTVITSDYEQHCYSDEGRPIKAPSENETLSWTAPKDKQ